MIGALQSFNADRIYEVVEMFVEADEVERALWILNNLPGRYRDEVPVKLAKLKTDILSAMVTPHAYQTCGLDAEVNKEENLRNFNWLLRCKLVEEEAKRFGKGFFHVVDVGPGEYMVPMGLKERGYDFGYNPIFMDGPAFNQAKSETAGLLEKAAANEIDLERCLFLALEIIEHLPAPIDLATECLRHCGGWPIRIHLSTPMYTFDGSSKPWRKPCGLPHLRTYTPSEFLLEAQRVFPGYAWQLYPGRIMSLRGMRRDAVDAPFEGLEQIT